MGEVSGHGLTPLPSEWGRAASAPSVPSSESVPKVELARSRSLSTPQVSVAKKSVLARRPSVLPQSADPDIAPLSITGRERHTAVVCNRCILGKEPEKVSTGGASGMKLLLDVCLSQADASPENVKAQFELAHAMVSIAEPGEKPGSITSGLYSTSLQPPGRDGARFGFHRSDQRKDSTTN